MVRPEGHLDEQQNGPGRQRRRSRAEARRIEPAKQREHVRQAVERAKGDFPEAPRQAAMALANLEARGLLSRGELSQGYAELAHHFGRGTRIWASGR